MTDQKNETGSLEPDSPNEPGFQNEEQREVDYIAARADESRTSAYTAIREGGRRSIFRAAVHSLLSLSYELQALRLTIRDKQTEFDVHIGAITPPAGVLDKIEEHIGQALRDNATEEADQALDALALQRAGTPNAGDASTEQKAEELARILLQRQLRAGEANVGWGGRTRSRRERVDTARFILENCVGLTPDDATVRLANHHGWDPNKAERILNHAWAAMNDAHATIFGDEIRPAVEAA